jgi:hypothetical protein
MFKLFIFLVVSGLSGCTQAQRLALMENAEMDRCAMNRMTQTTISGQHGYLRARYECRHEVIDNKLAKSLRAETKEQQIERELRRFVIY